MTGDGATMEEALHNTSQVQAHMGYAESDLIEKETTFTELTGASWHEIVGGCLHHWMPHRAAF